ncbi:MAG: dynamin family protein [Ruminococcus sp.]|nr:dynamin family protein [Ruminococcus sp.]MCM1382446.1 dynamin family protein [Muribaculaceae bacterium]MCM1479326.1 dynamin family protein [Muribaculaceae bacterium]
MQKFENARQEYVEMLNCQVSGISKILNVDKTNELISFQVQENLLSIRATAERLKKKLETNEFEIAIVGLEKAGKSTFANALMGNNILPTKDERCTYTSTSIRYGSYDEATVEFFSRDEFNKDFNQKLAKLQIESDMPFDVWTDEMFEKKLSEKGELMAEHANLKKDIKEIIDNKSSIDYLLGKEKRTFSSEDFETEVKDYIEKPGKAIAVKEIVIRSSKLEKMKNAVIYDVPGFDSPTQMHKDQTMAKMKQADAIILIVAADKPSFNDSLVKFFSNVSYDDDGIKISDKTFVFGNRADCATTLSDNKKKIVSELTDYKIMNPANISDRLILGSAKAKMDIEKGETGSPAVAGINAKGISDGIDDIRGALERYNDKERLDVLSKKVIKLAGNIHDLMEDLKQKNSIAFSGTDEFESEKNKIKINSPEQIRERLGACRAKIVDNCRKEKTITNKVCDNIVSKISKENYSITEEEILRARNLSQSGVEVIGKIDAGIRDEKFTEIYNDFIDGVVNLAVDEHNESDILIKNAFMEGLDISENSKYYSELNERITEFIRKHIKNSAPAGYYSSLIRRYSRDLFEILIGIPYALPERYMKFESQKMNFYSLSLFDVNYDVSVLPGKQPMHSQILFHIMPSDVSNSILENAVLLVENIIQEVILVNDKMYKLLDKFVSINKNNSLDRLRELLSSYNYSDKNTEFTPAIYPQNNPVKESIYEIISNDIDAGNTAVDSAEITMQEYKNYFVSYEKSLEKIKEEFDDDLFMLHDILNNQVMKAIAIETPFIDLIKQEISDIIDSTKDPAFLDFIDEYAEQILAEKAEQALKDRAKREMQQKILAEISTILESIPMN